MVSDVSESLHTFFVPQMEQLGVREQPSKCGSLSILDSELGTGTLWAHSITDECLFTFHDIHLSESMDLMEFPEDCICIASMTDHSAKLCPIEAHGLHERNVVSFQQEGGTVRFTLNPGERHTSYTLCMTPEFFDRLEGVSDDERDALVRHLRNSETNALPPEIGRALESLGPMWATRSGGALFCEAKLNEVLACALSDAARDALDGHEDATADDREIADEARRIIDERFAERLTLHSIADELFVGKTKLCSAFRSQTGMHVAEYLRSRRLEEARILLEASDLRASEIGSAVGYAHQSSFSDAFRRRYGLSPSQWRAKRRRP